MSSRARIAAQARSLQRWSVTPTGALYVALLVAAVVAFVIQPVAAIPFVIAALVTIIPLKLMHLERGMGILGTRQAASERQLTDLADTLSAHREAHVDLNAILGELRQARADAAQARTSAAEARRLAVEAQQRAERAERWAEHARGEARDARKDALSGVDTARSEWADILRAERRRPTAGVGRDIGDAGGWHTDTQGRDPSRPDNPHDEDRPGGAASVDSATS